MVYCIPTLSENWPHSRGNVGKYSIHGSHGTSLRNRCNWMPQTNLEACFICCDACWMTFHPNKRLNMFSGLKTGEKKHASVNFSPKLSGHVFSKSRFRAIVHKNSHTLQVYLILILYIYIYIKLTTSQFRLESYLYIHYIDNNYMTPTHISYIFTTTIYHHVHQFFHQLFPIFFATQASRNQNLPPWLRSTVLHLAREKPFLSLFRKIDRGLTSPEDLTNGLESNVEN